MCTFSFRMDNASTTMKISPVHCSAGLIGLELPHCVVTRDLQLLRHDRVLHNLPCTRILRIGIAGIMPKYLNKLTCDVDL